MGGCFGEEVLSLKNPEHNHTGFQCQHGGHDQQDVDKYISGTLASDVAKFQLKNACNVDARNFILNNKKALEKVANLLLSGKKHTYYRSDLTEVVQPGSLIE